ncbi:hypothetical protein SEUCBS140593_006693 [Sporothrix eucalyptigena]|uniref:Rhamnogalacturonase A n=1 Tax=Sporothrix eucalyptigena TaxID=1812306 RepID=A0ABP0C6Y6_9PEZI
MSFSFSRWQPALLFDTLAMLLVHLLFAGTALAQLQGRVGPTTSTAAKRAVKVCSVLDHGATASQSSDIGPALVAAFSACKSGGIIYVPPGEYGMSTWVSLSGGSGWALQLDGIIYRTGTAGGNMIYIEKAKDVEIFSSTSQGAIQGNGFEYHKDGKNGCRILRLAHVDSFSIHDIAIVDSPLFHLFMDTVTNGEVYNLIIRGGNKGGLDGIDVSGANMWLHDIEVSNRDECVTIKNPSQYMLIENIYCNWSGGCAMGSLGGTDIDIHNIHFDKVYSANCNQMFMIKSNGGAGTVHDCSFTSFLGRHNAYTLDIDANWSQLKKQSGDGVLFRDLNFTGWHGSCSDGNRRAPINVMCPDAKPCYNIHLSDFAVWTEAGSREVYKCSNAYGEGGCLKGGGSGGASLAAYAVTTVTVASAPSGWNAPTMAADLTTLGLSSSIPIPAVPTSFFPGATPYSKLAGGAAASSAAAKDSGK